MGATVFGGLIVLTLITRGQPEIVYAVPYETMEGLAFTEDLPGSVEPQAMAWTLHFTLPDDPVVRDQQTILSQAPRAGAAVVASLQSADIPQSVAEVTAISLPVADVMDVSITPLFAPDPVRGPGMLAQAPPAEALPVDPIFARPADPIAPLSDVPPLAPPKIEALVALTPPKDAALAPPRSRPAHNPQPRAGGPVVTGPLSAPDPQTRMAAQVPPGQPDHVTRLTQLMRPPVLPPLPDALLAPQAVTAFPQMPPDPRPALVNGDFVFLREAPSGSAAPLGQFDVGTEALLREERGLWRRVTIEGLTGWMFADYLTPNRLE